MNFLNLKTTIIATLVCFSVIFIDEFLSKYNTEKRKLPKFFAFVFAFLRNIFTAFRKVCASALGVLTPMVIFFLTLHLVDNVQNKIHNNEIRLQDKAHRNEIELSKTNEPLILENEPRIQFKGNEGKVNIKVKQGTVIKSELILFKNNGVAIYVPLHFTKKEKKLSSNYFHFTEFTPQNRIPLIKAKDDNLNEKYYPITGEVTASKKLVRFGIVSKDSKGNVTADYYIVRPYVKSHVEIKMAQNYDNKEYVYDHRYYNHLNNFCISCPINGSNSFKTDTSNIMYELSEHRGEFQNYEYDLNKKKDQRIDGSKFKASQGSGTLQEAFEKDHPNSRIGAKAKLYNYLDFEVPTEGQIQQDVLEMDNIIKDFQKS